MASPASIQSGSRLRSTLLAALALAYPLFVYLGIDRLGVRWIALAALALVGLQWFLLRGRSNRAGALGSTLQLGNSALRLLPLLGLWIAATISGDEHLLMLVPALGSVILGLMFANSLNGGRTPWVEQVARVAHGMPQLPPTAIRHCRRVTGLWAGFLVSNGLVGGALAYFGPRAWWALYSGLIAYILVGLLMAGEYLYRQRVVRPVADREEQELGLRRSRPES